MLWLVGIIVGIAVGSLAISKFTMWVACMSVEKRLKKSDFMQTELKL